MTISQLGSLYLALCLLLCELSLKCLPVDYQSQHRGSRAHCCYNDADYCAGAKIAVVGVVLWCVCSGLVAYPFPVSEVELE